MYSMFIIFIMNLHSDYLLGSRELEKYVFFMFFTFLNLLFYIGVPLINNVFVSGA